MQHDTDQRVLEMTARPDGQRLLPFRLEPLFRVARQFFQTLSLHQSAIPCISSSIKTAPCAHQRLEVISVATCVGVRQPNPHLPRPLNVIGGGALVDT